MKNIREIFGLNKTSGLFGVEVEVEGRGLKFLDHNVDGPWKTEADGSLRGGFPEGCCEYVLHKPIPFGRVKPALEFLGKALDEAKEVNFSFRTSVHVHYNVQEYSAVQVMNMIYTYILIEGAMMNFCGEERINNRFCLRVRDAEGIIPILQQGFGDGLQSFRLVNENAARYSALNICSLMKYGSLEFRGMHGTSDINKLMTWITAINYIGEYAKEKANPSEIYNQFIQFDNKEDFLNVVLRDIADKFKFPGLNDEANLSFSLSIDLPFTYAASVKVVDKEQKAKTWMEVAAVQPRMWIDPADIQAIQNIVPRPFEEMIRARRPARMPAQIADHIIVDDIIN